MNGLDPHAADGVREMLRALCREAGVTVLMSTHNPGNDPPVLRQSDDFLYGVNPDEGYTAEPSGAQSGFESGRDFCKNNPRVPGVNPRMF